MNNNRQIIQLLYNSLTRDEVIELLNNDPLNYQNLYFYNSKLLTKKILKYLQTNLLKEEDYNELIKSLELDKIKKDWDSWEFYKNNKYTYLFIKKFQDEVDWEYISLGQQLSEEFIEKFKDKVDWTYIFRFQTLSESFIEKFKDKVDWYWVSIQQKLSESFIEKFQDEVDWEGISVYQKLSEEFRIRWRDKLS